METTNVDFHSLPRRDLQALCKKHKIPANMTNVAMADALKALLAAEEVEKRELESPKKAEAPRGTTSHRPARSSRRGAARGEEKEIDGIPLVELPDTPVQPAGRMTRAREAPKVEEEEARTARTAVARSRPRKAVSFAVSEQEPGESRFPKEVRKTPVASRARSVEKEKSSGFGSRHGTSRRSSSRRDVSLAAEAKMMDLSELEKPEEGMMESGVGEEQNHVAVEPELSDSVLTQENGRPDDGDVLSIGLSGSAEAPMVEEPDANVPNALSDDGGPVEAAHEEGEGEEEAASAVEADPGNGEELPAPDIPVVAAETVGEDHSPSEVPVAEQTIVETEPQRASSGDEDASYPIGEDHMEEEMEMKQSGVAEEPIILPEAQGILEFEDVVLEEAQPLCDETPVAEEEEEKEAAEDTEEVLEAELLGEENPADPVDEKHNEEEVEMKQSDVTEAPIILPEAQGILEFEDVVLEAQPLGDETPVNFMAEEEKEAAEDMEEVLDAELLGEGNPADLVDEKHAEEEVEMKQADVEEEPIILPEAQPLGDENLVDLLAEEEEEAAEDIEEELEAELLGEGNPADLVDEEHAKEVEATEDMEEEEHAKEEHTEEEEHAGDFIVDHQSVFPSEHVKEEEAAEDMEEILEAELLGEGNQADLIAKKHSVEEEAAKDMEEDAEEEQSFPEDSSPSPEVVTKCEEKKLATLLVEAAKPHSFSALPLSGESDHMEIEDAAVSGSMPEPVESDSKEMAEEQEDAPASEAIQIGAVATVEEVPSLPMETALPTTNGHPVQMDEQQIGEEGSLPEIPQAVICADQEKMVEEEVTEEEAAVVPMDLLESKEPPSESTFQMQEDGAVAALPAEITMDASESIVDAAVNRTIEAPVAEKEEELKLSLVTPVKRLDDNGIATDKVRFSARRSAAIPLSDFKENGGVMYGSGIKLPGKHAATAAKPSRPTREEMQGWSMRRLRKQLQELTLGDTKKTNEDNNSKVSTNQSEGRLALGTLNNNCLSTYQGF